MVVRDVVKGPRRRLRAPSGCAFADVGAGSVLWNCPLPASGGTHGVTDDLVTHSRSVLPNVVPDPQGAEDSATYVEVGKRWAAVRIRFYHGSRLLFVERSSGRQAALHLDDRQHVFDLDRPGVVRTLCTGQEAPLVEDPDNGIAPTFGPLNIDGVRAASTTQTDNGLAVQYQRCGQTPKTLRRCAYPCQINTAQIEGPWVAWTERTGSSDSNRTRGVLVDTRTMRRQTLDVDGIEILANRIAITRHGRLKIGRLPS